MNRNMVWRWGVIDFKLAAIMVLPKEDANENRN